MSKPRPKILLQDQTKDEVYEVCTSTAVYAVFYGDQSIKVRKIKHYDTGLTPKYVKTAFPESGHAIRLARLLNKRFNTDLFQVRCLQEGRVVGK